MIIKNKVFEAIILSVIFFNTVILMIADPNVDDLFDDFFVYFYTAEMSLKILGLGFILSKGTYLRDGWNVLDFVIVTSSLLPYLLNGKTSFSLSSLRSLRILRPLRAISSISALKVYLDRINLGYPTNSVLCYKTSNRCFYRFVLLSIYLCYCWIAVV